MHFDVVVLGNALDPHVASVLAELELRDVSSICIDQVLLWQDTVTFDPCALRLIVGDRTVTSCHVVWNRRAYPPHIEHMTTGDLKFARTEFSHTLYGSLRALSNRWFNQPDAIYCASFKAAQLHWAARERQLRIPMTLITSNIEYARALLLTQSSRCVVKSVNATTIQNEGGYETFFTSLVDENVLSRFEDLKHSPCIIQEFIARKYDVRINVLGDAVFGTRLDTCHITEAIADSRRVPHYRDIKHSAINVPDVVADACRSMCRYFHLRFGAFDFGVDADDRWFFFELNPNGQWYWIEEMTGQALSKAMADEIHRQIEDAVGDR